MAFFLIIIKYSTIINKVETENLRTQNAIAFISKVITGSLIILEPAFRVFWRLLYLTQYNNSSTNDIETSYNPTLPHPFYLATQ
jgi:hypothetical protein